MYDAATGRLLWNAELPSSPGTDIDSHAFSRDGTEMLYSNGHALYVLDPATGAVRDVPVDAPCPEEAAPLIIADGALRIDVDHPLIGFPTTEGGE